MSTNELNPAAEESSVAADTAETLPAGEPEAVTEPVAEATENDVVTAEAVVAAPVLPGRRLREAREQARMTVAEVAQTLKFGVRQIEALEADDYDNLPGTTFLRGFVRSYAKLLKLEAADLLALLDQRAPAHPPDVRAPQNMGEAVSPQVGARRSSSPLLMGTAVLLLAALALAGWHFLGGKGGSASTLPRGAGNGSPAAAESPPAPVVAAAVGEAPLIKPPQLRVEPTPAASSESVAPVLPPGGRQLVFVFEERSWLEVKDAAQRTLVTGVFPPGERQTASGKPPFNIWVGKASAVRVFDGETQIDLKPHTRDDVARLTVQ